MLPATAIDAGTTVGVLVHDPELARYVPAAERALAERLLQFSAEWLEPGPWQAAREPVWGLLVLDGLLVRDVRVAGEAAAEVLGPGDVILRHHVGGPDPLLCSTVTWSVLTPVRVAWLGDRFGNAVRRWPGLAVAMLERAEQRASRISVDRAISHIQRVDRRALALLWHLAERFGRVGSERMTVPLSLTHQMIGELIGARRPTVTTALAQLGRAGLVSRRDDGAWVLHGAPPAELRRRDEPRVWRAPELAEVVARRPADEEAKPMPAVTAHSAAHAEMDRLRAAYDARVSLLEQATQRALELHRRSDALIAQGRARRARTLELLDGDRAA